MEVTNCADEYTRWAYEDNRLSWSQNQTKQIAITESSSLGTEGFQM